MRKGRHTAAFLLIVALFGLVIGAAISFVLSSVSTDAAFFAIVGVTVLLVIIASSLRAASEKETPQEESVRDVAAVVPVPAFVEARVETAAAKLSRSEPEGDQDPA